MKRIPLTRGYEALVDDEDYKWLSQWKWCALVTKKNVYAKRTKQAILMHRVIEGATASRQVDHRDGNGLNNQRSNLRKATQTQNNANSRLRRSSTSGYKGVTWFRGNWASGGKWMAQIAVNGRHVYLGYFDTPQAAHEAYCAAAKRLFGEFWRAA
jgi:hypothetical protein